MKEVILCKYGELVLKGANKSRFEAMLVRRCRQRAERFGNFMVSARQSTVYVEPMDELCDMDGMLESMCRMPGFNRVSVAAVCDKSMESLRECVREYLPHRMAGVKTFKVEAKRADKAFPLNPPRSVPRSAHTFSKACAASASTCKTPSASCAWRSAKTARTSTLTN